jgi:hypothetical protein
MLGGYKFYRKATLEIINVENNKNSCSNGPYGANGYNGR